jgi:hypothetical protein
MCNALSVEITARCASWLRISLQERLNSQTHKGVDADIFGGLALGQLSVIGVALQRQLMKWVEAQRLCELRRVMRVKALETLQ